MVFVTTNKFKIILIVCNKNKLELLNVKRWFQKRTVKLKDSDDGKVQQGFVRVPNTVRRVRFIVRKYFGN
jgi:hypothetical protein